MSTTTNNKEKINSSDQGGFWYDEWKFQYQFKKVKKNLNKVMRGENFSERSVNDKLKLNGLPKDYT